MACAEHADNPQPSWCAECMETEPPKPLPGPGPWGRIGGGFFAAYDGDCPGCPDRIRAGAIIIRWDRGEGHQLETVYTHSGCRP